MKEIDQIIIGDSLSVLRTFPDESVHCCVTSPPYWGLRDYGTATWTGGDPDCDHLEGAYRGDEGERTWDGGPVHGGKKYYKHLCAKCEARRTDDQLGLEDTPEEYIEKMVKVFAEVKRVLRSDGTLWCNIGDCYAGSNMIGGTNSKEIGKHKERMIPLRNTGAVPKGLKTKDLCGMPWRLAFALQSDGWYLRSDIIWHKPNPMPESVTDRPTKSHEYLFLLSKSARYFYDAEAIKEPAKGWNESRFEDGKNAIIHPNVGKKRKPAGWNTGNGSHGTIHRDGRAKEVEYTNGIAETRNKRTVWTIPTHKFPGAHFAVFPPALIEPCILAGCPRDGIVLDPFMGAGTTAIVALKHGRHYVGIELKPEYAEMARNRIKHGTVDAEEIYAAELQPSLFE